MNYYGQNNVQNQGYPQNPLQKTMPNNLYSQQNQYQGGIQNYATGGNQNNHSIGYQNQGLQQNHTQYSNFQPGYHPIPQYVPHNVDKFYKDQTNNYYSQRDQRRQKRKYSRQQSRKQSDSESEDDEYENRTNVNKQDQLSRNDNQQSIRNNNQNRQDQNYNDYQPYRNSSNKRNDQNDRQNIRQQENNQRIYQENNQRIYQENNQRNKKNTQKINDKPQMNNNQTFRQTNRNDNNNFVSKALITQTVNFSRQQSAELCQLQQQLKFIKSQRNLYTDQQFPAQVQSITDDPQNWHNSGNETRAQNMIWNRSTKILKNKLTLVDDGLSPNDIKQGELGDCYFLSSLSVLTEQPILIERLFEQFKLNDQGCYCIWLCIDGEWTNFIIDDQIPCTQQNQPVFSQSYNGELWVLLLEKCYAKAYNSYSNIESGITNQALRDLTGAPYSSIDNQKTNIAEIWDFLYQNDQRGYILTSGSQQSVQGDKEKDSQGIVFSHAYGILDVAQIQQQNGNKLQLIKMRNPWGDGEWTGDWSDGSNLWTPELKKQLNWKNSNDGSFWIDVKDYSKQFSQTFVSYCNQKYLYSYYKLNMQKHNTQIIGFTCQDNGHCFIQLSQKCARHFKTTNPNYQYSFVSFIVYQEDQQGNVIKVLGGQYINVRDLCIQIDNLKQGQYFVYVSVDWNQNYANQIVVSSYSQQDIFFDKKESILLNDDVINKILIKYKGKNEIKTLPNKCTELFDTFAGYVYISYNNPTNRSLNFQITPTTQNLLLCPPYQDGQSIIKFELEANSRDLVKWRINPKGLGAYNISYQESMQQ